MTAAAVALASPPVASEIKLLRKLNRSIWQPLRRAYWRPRGQDWAKTSLPCTRDRSRSGPSRCTAIASRGTATGRIPGSSRTLWVAAPVCRLWPWVHGAMQLAGQPVALRQFCLTLLTFFHDHCVPW